MAYIQSQVKPTDSLAERCGNLLRVMLKRYKNYRLYAETVSELNALTGRELTDLGLSRSMIKGVALSAVYEGRDSRKDGI